MDKLLELLGIKDISEEKKSEIKTYLDTLIQTKMDEEVEKKVTEKELELQEAKKQEIDAEKQNLVEKFEEYKEEITEKLSNFIDSVIQEDVQIPEKLAEFARKGELYEDVLETLKVRMAIDEGMISDEVKELLSEAKAEIVKSREKADEQTEKMLTLEAENKKLKTQSYINEKCEGLPTAKRKKIVPLLEGLSSEEEIDKKFDILIEMVKDSVSEEDEDTVECSCPECGKSYSVNDKCSMHECEECEVKLTEKKEKEDKDDKKKTDESSRKKTDMKAFWLNEMKKGKQS